MNFGSQFLGGHRPDHSAYLVRRLQRGGLRDRRHDQHARVRDPADHRAAPHRPDAQPVGHRRARRAAPPAARRRRSPAGMVPVAHGNDGGGSLRIPAACCGLVGLKPSRGRVSRGPDLGDSFLACDGVLTRTVAETAPLLDVLAGYEVGDATWAPRPAEPYATSVRRDPGRLRVAMTAANALERRRRPGVPARRCARPPSCSPQLGHEVEEASPALPGQDALRAVHRRLRRRRSRCGIAYGAAARRARPPEEDEIEPLSRAIVRPARSDARRSSYLAAVAQLQALARGVVAFFAEYDVLLTPALAERPLPIGECDGHGERPDAPTSRRSGRFTPFTALFNVTGQPAISVPAGFGDDGLPTSVAARRQAARRGHAAAGRRAARGGAAARAPRRRRPLA